MKIASKRSYHALRVVVRFAFRAVHPIVRVKGRENIPAGAAMLCCNHSSFSDPIWVIAFGSFDELPRTMAKKELLQIPIFGGFLRKIGAFPVDREGRDVAAIQTAMRALRSGSKVLIFPEGTRIRGGKTAEPHDGAVVIASRMNVPIVPIYLTAKKRLFGRIDLVFGKPIAPPFDRKKATEEELNRATVEMMAKIYAMGDAL